MKAAVCHEFGRPLVVEEVEIDPLDNGEVQVRLAACAICHSDIIYADGGWGGPLPAIYGHEAAGVVEAIGPRVKLVEPGDHVMVTLIRACGHCILLPERGADGMSDPLRARRAAAHPHPGRSRRAPGTAHRRICRNRGGGRIAGGRDPRHAATRQRVAARLQV